MAIPNHFDFYNVVLWIHVTSAVVAFGGTFWYFAFYAIGRRSDPRGLPYLHRVQAFVGERIITPGLGVLIASGIYMASARWQWHFWIAAALVLAVILGAMGGLFFSPTEKRLAEISQRDVAAAGPGEVTLSPDYDATLARMIRGNMLGSGIVLVALVLMIFKPGA
jgi:hypothetical protein